MTTANFPVEGLNRVVRAYFGQTPPENWVAVLVYEQVHLNLCWLDIVLDWFLVWFLIIRLIIRKDLD
jgi:hypothetical protein